MENSSNSDFSSWLASGSYDLAAAAPVESYTGEGSMPSSSYFMNAGSGNNFGSNELGQNYSMFPNECFNYNAQADLLSGSNFYSTYGNDYSIMEPVNLQGFGFEEEQNNIMLNKTVHLAAGAFSTQEQVQNAVCPAPIPTFMPQMAVNPTEGIQLAPKMDISTSESKNECPVSHPAGVQAQSISAHGNSVGIKPRIRAPPWQDHHNIREREQNAAFPAPIPTFVSQMAVNPPEGIQLAPKMDSSTSESKNECPVSHPACVQAQSIPAHGNSGGVKPRKRAPRGQATDRHSIKERLRRETISHRVKNLQELVPNSTKAPKATMLDQIIDYMKFLQHQVLSMSRLGAPGAVVPVHIEFQADEGSNSQPLTALITARGQLDVQDSEGVDTLAAFEEEIVQLMETSITSAMQYLQDKGLCLMPVALASAICKVKGTDTAVIPPKM